MMYWTSQWQLNLSVHCPRGGTDNLNSQEWYARQIAREMNSSLADGIEFDVGRWKWGNSILNPMDANNDGIADYGYINGVNSFGIGGQLFLKELRQLVGPSKIIQVDSNDALNGVRGWKYLNGVQLESFPDANNFNRFSEAFQHLRLWSENAEFSPRVSYPFTKSTTTVFGNSYLLNGSKTDFHFRVGFASACLVGMPHPFAYLDSSNFDPQNPGSTSTEVFGVFNWDEYHGGDLNNPQWLGKPNSVAIRDSSTNNQATIIDQTDWQWKIKPQFIASGYQSGTTYSTNVKSIPEGILPDSLMVGVTLVPKNGYVVNVIAGQEYSIEFEARGDDYWSYMGQLFEKVPRMINIQGFLNVSENPLTVLVDNQWRKYKLSFVAPLTTTVIPYFGVSEQIGNTEIKNIKIFNNGSERWSREFEKGLVLLNMTHTPWSINVKGGCYRHLRGNQDSTINNGQYISNQIVVPAQDAVFLVNDNLGSLTTKTQNIPSVRLVEYKYSFSIANLKVGSDIYILDISGKKIFQQQVDNNQMAFSKAILKSAGMYVIYVSDYNGINWHLKLIKRVAD